jgi:replicative DNA helicase
VHWLLKKLQVLPDEEREQVMAELLDQVTAAPVTKSDRYRIALMADYTDQAVSRYENFGKMQGLSTGFPSVDNLTKGLVGGELVVVAGKTSQGKTTFATNIASHVAAAGRPVLFVTMEMSHSELTSRYMHLYGGLTANYHTASTLTLFQKNDELNWQDVDGLVATAVSEMNVQLVIIDHLHYFTRELTNVAEDLGRITKELKKNAIRHNLPIILISHVRKGGEAAATMEDLRGSSYIAQDADIVLMVGRDPKNPSKFGVRIQKNRNRGFEPDKDLVELLFDRTKLTEPTGSTLGVRNPWK